MPACHVGPNSNEQGCASEPSSTASPFLVTVGCACAWLQVRHQASQEDKLTTYGWVRHDGRTFGRQLLVDEDYNITVSMVRGKSTKTPNARHLST